LNIYRFLFGSTPGPSRVSRFNGGPIAADPSVHQILHAPGSERHVSDEAMEGGDSLLVSVETIFNRMRAERPDLLALLFDPIATDRRGEVPEGMKPFMEIPPLSWHAGHLTVFYQRQYIDSAQRFPDAMRLTARSRGGARYVRRSRE
jgi:hypothetical protein